MSRADHSRVRAELSDLLDRGDWALLGAKDVQLKLFRPGETIARASEPHDFVYRVRTGWICRARALPGGGGRRIISIALAGDLVGIKNLLFPRHPDALECLTEVTAHAIHRAALQELATGHAEVGLRVMSQLAEEERRLHNWVIGLLHGGAEERLAVLLLSLHNRLRRLDLIPDDTFQLPMTQRQIGDHVGVTLAHVSRVLKRFRTGRVATVERGAAVIHDSAALERIARPVLDLCGGDP